MPSSPPVPFRLLALPADGRPQADYSACARIPGRLRARWAQEATRLGSIPGRYEAFGKNETKYIQPSIQA